MHNNIRSERVRKRMTQAQFASEVGVAESTVRDWESGRSDPNMSSIVRMTQIFGCSADYVIGLSDERKAS